LLGKSRKSFEILRSAKIQETIGGIKDIKIRNKENEFSSNYFFLANSISKFFYKYYAIQKVPRIYLETSIIICLSFLTFFLFKKNNLDVNAIFSTLAINFAIFLRLMPSVNKLVNAFNTNNWSKQSAYEIINLSQKKNITKKLVKPNFKKDLRFENLSFSYNNQKNLIIKNLNLTIKKGEKIAIIGNSGLGKSTFVEIFCGLLDTIKGKIKIDGKDLSNKKTVNFISYAPQTPFLFDDTLYYNITLEKEVNNKILEKFNKILNICELQKFHKLNIKKRKNYSLGDKGVKISGGQKQRVGLARCLFNESDIIILDEPTSSLEQSLEKKIITKILKYFANKTIVAITHKKSVAKMFDKTLILKKKKLINYNFKK
jgi:ABC-type bacteriocin/lantibiotic exporter with double-glycine peptidase domain